MKLQISSARTKAMTSRFLSYFSCECMAGSPSQAQKARSESKKKAARSSTRRTARLPSPGLGRPNHLIQRLTHLASKSGVAVQQAEVSSGRVDIFLASASASSLQVSSTRTVPLIMREHC